MISISGSSDSSAYVLGRGSASQWQVFGYIERVLSEECGWVVGPENSPRADLVLIDRGRTNWGALAVARKGGKKKLVNYFRGCKELTNKSLLSQNLAHYAQTMQGGEALAWNPRSFRITTGAGTDVNPDDRQAFLACHATLQEQGRRRGAQEEGKDSGEEKEGRRGGVVVWIAKLATGCKGASIKISDDPSDILAFIDAAAATNADGTGAKVGQQAGTGKIGGGVQHKNKSANKAKDKGRGKAAAMSLRERIKEAKRKKGVQAKIVKWIVQRYIHDPFLLDSRKFDIRCWVLLTPGFRLASVPYTLDSFEDEFTHLTNHCIQEGHPSFGDKVKGNELFFSGLAAALREGGKWTVESDLVPQIKAIVRHSVKAVQELLQLPEQSNYRSFQLFGYDFLLDSSFKLHLLEINATPAAAEACLDPLVRSLIQTVIEPEFPAKGPAAAIQTRDPKRRFKLIYNGKQDVHSVGQTKW